MIFKFKNQNTKRKSHPIIGILLLTISIILFVLTVPIGIVYGYIYKLFTKSIAGIGEFSLNIAISIDQLGNVTMQYLLNAILIVKGGYKFGNRDETISSVIGKNVNKNTLSVLGKLLNTILNTIDSGHSLNSIDYHLEPMADKIKK